MKTQRKPKPTIPIYIQRIMRGGIHYVSDVVIARDGKMILLFGVHSEALRKCLGDAGVRELNRVSELPKKPHKKYLADLNFLRDASLVRGGYEKNV